VRCLLRSRAEVITIKRDYDVTVSSATAYDPDGGTDAGLTLVVANGAVNAALNSAAARGDEVIYATGVTAGKSYRLVSADGRTLPIYVEGVSGTACTLATKIPFGIASGYIKSVESTITLTIPSTYTSRTIEIEYTLSDSSVYRESCLVASRKLMVPITTDDILARYPRLRNRAQGELGFDVQIADVLAKARAQFWLAGYVLDDIVQPALLKDYLMAEVCLQLTVAGYDLTATGDRIESSREFERMRDQERSMLMNAQNLWIDEDEDRDQDDGETGPVGTIRLDWRRR